MFWAAKPNDPRTSRRRCAKVRSLPRSEICMTTIAILDDDHVIRLTRYAISGPGEITTDWAPEFFMPEEADPARFYALGACLHESDGVSLIPMSAKLDLHQGSDASILIFRRGSIDAPLMAESPNPKPIQRTRAP